MLDKFWTVLTGGVFQVLRHENIDSGLFTPNGMLALFTVSLPLMTLGALALLARLMDGRRVKGEKAAARAMVKAAFAVTLVCLVYLEASACWITRAQPACLTFCADSL